MLWRKKLVIWGKDVLGAARDIPGQGMGEVKRDGSRGRWGQLGRAPCPGMESTSEAELSRPTAGEEGKLRQKQE